MHPASGRGGIAPEQWSDGSHVIAPLGGPQDQRFLVFFFCGGVQSPRCNWQRE